MAYLIWSLLGIFTAYIVVVIIFIFYKALTFQAWFLIDYSSEHNLMWVVAIDETDEIWTFQNPEVRAKKNITMDRILGNSIDERVDCVNCKGSFHSSDRFYRTFKGTVCEGCVQALIKND